MQLSTDDINAREEATVKQNVWHCSQEICDRIDEAPGPHGYMSAHVTPRPGKKMYKTLDLTS